MVGNREGWPRRAGGSMGQFSKSRTGVYYNCTSTVKRNITAAWPRGAEGELRQGCCSVRGEDNSDEEGASHACRGQRRKRHPMMCQARQELAHLMSVVYTFFLRRAQFLHTFLPPSFGRFFLRARQLTHSLRHPPNELSNELSRPPDHLSVSSGYRNLLLIFRSSSVPPRNGCDEQRSPCRYTEPHRPRR